MRRAAPANWSNLPNRTVAFLHGLDPKRTFNGLLKPRRRSVWETRLLQRSNP